jgi:hypothetical protein
VTIRNIIETVTAWAQEHVCDGLQFKIPEDDLNDGEFPGATMEPNAFPCFLPARDRPPPGVRAPIPSVCVQLKEGTDRPQGSERTLQMRLSLAVWNPGRHGKNVLFPADDPFAELGKSYHASTNEEIRREYDRSMDGWRDVWNLADRALAALENADYIGPLRLMKEQGISYGPFSDDGAVWDDYPYWFLWIDFTLEAGPGEGPKNDIARFL